MSKVEQKKPKGVFIVCATFHPHEEDIDLWLPDVHYRTQNAALEGIYNYITKEYMSARDVREATADAKTLDEKLELVLKYMHNEKNTYIDYRVQYLSLA